MSATTSLDPQPAATAVTTALQHAAGRAADYARAAHAANTHRAYRVDWRDRALLLLGLASALTMADLGFVAEGVTLSVARSKTDQEAAGQIVGVVATGTPTCPVAAMRTWLDTAGITDGAVSATALIVKRRAAAANGLTSPGTQVPQVPTAIRPWSDAIR